jgi:hypothetical protein
MICGREGDLRPNLAVEIFEDATIKILGVVNCGQLWNSVATDNILLEEFLDGGGGYIGDGLHFDPLDEVFDSYDGEGVVSLCWREFANDIDVPPLQGPRWGDQLRKLCWRLGAMGKLLIGFIG